MEEKQDQRQTLTEEEIRGIFEAKCRDFDLKPTEKLFSRFRKHRGNQAKVKVFEMDNSSLGSHAAAMLTKVLLNHCNFKIISLSGNNFGDKGAPALVDLITQTRTIISVDLSSNSFTDDGFKTIFDAMCVNSSIIDLRIGTTSVITRNTIGPLGISSLAELISKNKILSSIDLSLTEMASENIEPLSIALAQNQTLESLNLSNNNIRSQGAIKIINSCKTNSLSELILSSNHLTDEIAPYFADFIQSNSKLTILDLSGNNLTHRFTSSISTSFANRTCYLQELNLSRNPLGSRGISALAHGIGSNTSLRRLDISACKIQHSGFAEFCTELVNNTSLESLIIHHNQIRDDGAKHLAEVIRIHPILNEIDMELCEISDKGAAEIFEAVTNSVSLEKLSIKNNLIHDGFCIQKAISANQNIRFLNIEYNDIEFKMYSEIQRTVAQNKKANAEKNEDKQAKDAIKGQEVDQQLLDVRGDIQMERIYIEQLQEQLRETEKRYEDTLALKASSAADLDAQLAEVTQRSVDALNEYRNITQEESKRQQEIEQAKSNLENRLARESDNFRLDSRNLQNIQKKLEAMQTSSETEMKELEDKLKMAKQNYGDSRRLLETAFQVAKAGPVEEAAPVEEQQTTPKKAKGKSKSKGKKSKKGAKKEKDETESKKSGKSKSSLKKGKGKDETESQGGEASPENPPETTENDPPKPLSESGVQP